MDSLKNRMKRKKGGYEEPSSRPTRMREEKSEFRSVEAIAVDYFKRLKLTSMSFPGPKGEQGTPGLDGAGSFNGYVLDNNSGFAYSSTDVIPVTATSLNAAVQYALAHGPLTVKAIPGATYIVSSQVLAAVPATKALQIICDGQCTIDDSGLSSPQGAIKFTQTSGDAYPNLIRGLSFIGNTTNSRHIEIAGPNGMRVENCHFAAGAMGVYFHNTAAGVFTEDCVVVNCRFASNVVVDLWYGTEGDQSFRGSGSINCETNIPDGKSH